MAEEAAAHLVEVVKATKRFPGVLALDRVSLQLRAGEVHAVIGENGAGKSTLMNILAGDLQPDEGALLVEGKPVRFSSSLDSRAAGIVVVYQELALCPTLTVAENIMMSEVASRAAVGLTPRAEMRREAREALTRLGMGALDVDAKVGRLSVAEMQLIEIARAVRQRARVLVLDEPNSALSTRESGRLFEVVRQLRAEGVTIVYVSHRLREVIDLADRITVMRDGRVIETIENREVDEDRLIRAMVGRELGAAKPWAGSADSRDAEIVLSVEGLTTPELHDVSFQIRGGEILGVGGLPDSGKDALGEALFGLCDRSGSVSIGGHGLRARDPVAAIKLGLSYAPADRRRASGLLAMSVADNVVSASLSRFSFAGFLRKGMIRREARAQVARLDARISHLGQKLGSLSGGNQQKIILGRGIVAHPRVMVLHEPTRGIDVGAKAEIYEILRGLAREGMAVLMISSEVPELIMNAERVLVLRNGRLSGDLSRGDVNEQAILTRMMA